MCTGFEWLLAAGATVSAGAALYQGEATKAREETLSATAERDSREERESAEQRADLIRKRARRISDDAIAGYAASGVDVSASGSPATLVDDIVSRGAEDAWQEIVTGTRRTRGFIEQAESHSLNARAARTQGRLGATGTILQSGASYAKAKNWSRAAPEQAGAIIEERQLRPRQSGAIY